MSVAVTTKVAMAKGRPRGESKKIVLVCYFVLDMREHEEALNN